ncbi:MAG: hypothetical protein LBT21_06385 [Oscillospiraceae bacterium]|jgi:hypothetical protein|nr:hypothetical protein [Oscillospiraceae bacterium]
MPIESKKSSGAIGRPRKVTPAVLRKLEEAFLYGATDAEARLFAGGLPESTFYDYCRLNPDFAKRKELLKLQTTLCARINVSVAIQNGDKELSKYYLDRKCREEFSTRQESRISEINPDEEKTLAKTIADAYQKRTGGHA